jgi:hypothetical protein
MQHGISHSVFLEGTGYERCSSKISAGEIAALDMASGKPGFFQCTVIKEIVSQVRVLKVTAINMGTPKVTIIYVIAFQQQSR